MKTIVQKLSLLALLLLLNIRCSGALTGGAGNTSDGPPGATPLAPRTIQIHTAIADELKPLTVQLETSKYLPYLDAPLPFGATYNGNTQTLRWIPKKGQAGVYSFVLGVTNDNVEHRLTLTVNPATEVQLKTGPYDIYQDGDVGYIFVHGAGDADRCTDTQDLEEYWGETKNIIAPYAAQRYVVCYDGRKDAEESAQKVAQQILQADCGKFNRCIIITHSMGGLIMNHILTHTRTPTINDPKQSLFDNRFLYQAVKNRALFVISLGSSAGGSKVANMVEHPQDYGIDQSIVDFIQSTTGYGPSGYTRSNEVYYATHVLAPINEDPEVPFFMVAGFSEKIVDEYEGQNINNSELPKIFNSDYELMALDEIAQFRSRSDGLVSFRSSCGVASDVVDDGPGRNASLIQQFQYCYQAPKKPNFYPWFAINLNHYLLASPTYDCNNTTNPCRVLFANAQNNTMAQDPGLAKKNAAQVIRAMLTRNFSQYNGTVNVQF